MKRKVVRLQDTGHKNQMDAVVEKKKRKSRVKLTDTSGNNTRIMETDKQ